MNDFAISLYAEASKPKPLKPTTIHPHRAIIDRCKAGDRQAQYRLYNLYVRAMYNVCYRMVNHQTDAEDILQDAFVKAFSKLDSYRYQSTFGAWLKRIVINETINFLKARKLPVCFTESLPDDIEEEVSPVMPINMKDVKAAMTNLPDGYRQILSLYLIEGYDHEEISSIAGITVSTSKSQFHRAKKKLIQLLNP